MKPDLLLEGQEAVFADLSNAHHCFLPRLLSDRIEHHQRNALRAPALSSGNAFVFLFVAWNVLLETVASLETEHLRLIDFLSTGDYYSKLGREGEDRDSVKKLANTVLNFPNEKAAVIPLYRKMRNGFPAMLSVVEDIKRQDHRNLSNPLRHYTAKSVEVALLQLQSMDIPTIPQTDALLCRSRDKEIVCRIFGAAVFKISQGVNCMIDGIRYQNQGSQGQPVRPSATGVL